MARLITILEDTAARVVAMRKVLAELLPGFEPVVFDNVTDFVDWLPDGLASAALICLDHDLGPTRERDGARFDPGIGRDAADVLATYPSTCPVVVHSSNSLAVPGMLRVLRESGWTCSAVMPTDDLRWIASDWRQELEWYFGIGWVR